jgi:hypothetical protein
MMNDEDFRDVCAMLAMNGIIVRGGLHPELMPEHCIARRSYELADAMVEAKNKTTDDGGITTIKKRKYVRKD